MAMMAELEIRLGEKASYCHYPQEADYRFWWMREEPQWVNLLGRMKRST
jgi:hypothetical protein